MKTQLLFALMIVIAPIAHANIRTVDNNVNHPVGAYTDITIAISASSSGDTIYVEGSPVSYGPFTVDRRLAFIGAGFVPSFNSNFVSRVGAITIQAGFGTTQSAASGSKFIGLWVEPPAGIEAVKMYCNCSAGSPLNGLTFTRCLFKISNKVAIYIDPQSGTANNVTIEGCVFLRLSTSDFNNDIVIGNGDNNNIRYNIISSVIQCNHSGLNAGSPQIFNNVFLIQATSPATYILGGGQNISNNIFFSTTPTIPASCNATFNWAPTAIAGFPNNLVGGGNPFAAAAGLFDFYPAKDYHVLATSNCHNAGIDGTDLGVYGGVIPSTYTDRGEPPIPVVKTFTITSTTSIPQNGTGSFNLISKVVP